MKNIDQYLDQDGYPTEEALEIIEKWDWKTQDIVKLFSFIHDIWYSERWNEEIAQKGNRTYHRYQFSTDGWSGNEAIIQALKINSFIYDSCLLEYRRGGHYVFDTCYLEDLK